MRSSHARVLLPLQREISLTLPIPPSANRYWRSVNGRVLVSAEAREYKRRIAKAALGAGVVPLLGAVVVDLDVYRARRAGDIDNFLKLALDSLKGIAFEDDSQVVEIHARRFDDKARPRVEITVRRA